MSRQNVATADAPPKNQGRAAALPYQGSWEKFAGVPLCLTFRTLRAGVWKWDKMSHNFPGKFTSRHAKFTPIIRLNPSLKIKAN